MLEQEEQEEQEETKNKEYFNADTSSVLPIEMTGLMYADQQRAYAAEQEFLNPQSPTQKREQSDYKVLFNDSDYLSSRVQIPPPNTSANINAFVEFLGSTYKPINDKYRINSNGPLI